MKKRVCFVTAARSEYGLMRWIIDAVLHDNDFDLQIIVTGAHLSPEQGLTYKYIEEDGYTITEKIPMLLSCNDEIGVVKSMGVCSISLADSFNRLKPDIVVVLGDRYELIPIVSTALLMRIPIAHIGGGDITEGAIDDEVRNAVTMMADIHFPGTPSSAENIIRMRGSNKYVFDVGEPGLDAFIREKLWSKDNVADHFNLDINKNWCLVTLHPETRLSIDQNIQMTKNLCTVLSNVENFQFIITKANTDVGGTIMNSIFTDFVSSHSENMQLYPSLGRIGYLSFMKYVNLVVGNSSSGIIEAPFFGIPVVNIGDRQKGRHLCKNVISCGRSVESISDALYQAFVTNISKDNYWGDGNTSTQILTHLKEYFYGFK